MNLSTWFRLHARDIGRKVVSDERSAPPDKSGLKVVVREAQRRVPRGTSMLGVCGPNRIRETAMTLDLVLALASLPSSARGGHVVRTY